MKVYILFDKMMYRSDQDVAFMSCFCFVETFEFYIDRYELSEISSEIKHKKDLL